MRLRAALPVVAVAAIVLALASCTTTTRSTACKNNVCTVKLSGEQSLEIGASTTRPLTVDPIEAEAVTVASRLDKARIGVGQTGTVGGMTVRVVSVSGKEVNLEVTLN